MTAGSIDVLVLAALKEELDALLQVKAAVREGWIRSDGDPPMHLAVLDGRSGPLRVAATWLTKMGGVAAASLAARLLETVKPRCIAMCGVCAGRPEDTDLGDVVIAERLFQHDEGKIRHDGFQGDFWVDALRDDWLRVAQDIAGPGKGFDLFGAPIDDDWKWWFLEQLAAGRDPLRSKAFRRYIPDDRRAEYLELLRRGRLVKLQHGVFTLTHAGKIAAAERRVLHGTLIATLPFHVHVGPMGSGNAVEAGGKIWDRLAAGGMRKTLAIDMEAAAIARVAHERGFAFAVVKGVMDHADQNKSDRIKAFAARAASEVLCKLLQQVELPHRDSSAMPTPPLAIPAPPVVLHPRDKEFVPLGLWEDNELVIKGGNLIIPAGEAGKLMKRWLHHFANPLQTETDIEHKYIGATLRACVDVYGHVPGETEMEKGVSILSRKYNLCFGYATAAHRSASRRNIDVYRALFDDEASPTCHERRLLLRTFLRVYVARLCEVNLLEAERIEMTLRDFPAWEPLVEQVYGVNEETVLGMLQAVKTAIPSVSDEVVADHIVANLIELQAGIEDFPSSTNLDDKNNRDRNPRRTTRRSQMKG